MPVTARARLAPASAPSRRAPRPESDTRLRLVDDRAVSPSVARRRRRLLVAAAALLACAALFGLAAFQAVLVSNQAELDRLADQADEEQARFQRLRLEVAQLESPERIVAVAQERLGMVPAAGVTYLSPSGVVSGEIEAAAATADGVAADEGGGDGRSWATVKPYLNDAP